MTVTAQRHPVTAEEYDAMPDRRMFELIGGLLIERRTSAHTSATTACIAAAITAFVDAGRLGHTFDATAAFRLNPDDPSETRRASVTFVPGERYHRAHAGDTDYVRAAPAFALQTVSPFDLHSEVRAKVDEWLRFGVRVVWVALPAAREIHVYAAGEHPRIYTADDEITLDAVLPGFRATVADLFPAL